MADPSSDAAPVPLAYESPSDAPPKLARTMGLTALVIYGVGDMLGAGIYALVGKAAGLMGNAVWIGFATAMVAALLTGLSYACIGSRYPRAAGAAYVTHRAYGIRLLSYVVGLTVAASGLTSMATGSRAIAGYIQKLTTDRIPVWLIVFVFLVLLAGIVFRGMRESTWMNAVCTTVEVSGLAIVIAVGVRYWGSVNYMETPPTESGAMGSLTVTLLLQGAVLTFFSFVGFEDILNVSEEVKDPRRTIPRGLILALLISTAIYMAVSISAVSVLHYSKLGASKNALQDVVLTGFPNFPAWLFTGISVFAVSNTALLNFVMGSRLLYGMSRQGMLPAPLAKIHRTRQTPHVAIAILFVIVLTLALSGDISALAKATSLLLLGVFVVVNVALILLKLRPDEPRGAFEVPIFVPALGALICLALVVSQVVLPLVEGGSGLWPALMAPAIALSIVVIILAFYLVLRPKTAVLDDAGDADMEAA